MSLLPQWLQFTQELIELGGIQSHQPLEGTRSRLQFLYPQHPSPYLPQLLLRNRFSVALTDQPSTIDYPISWKYVWDEKYSAHPKYMYLLELERFEKKGRPSLIIRGERQEHVEDQLLVELLKQAVNIQGQWQRYDKETKTYQNRIQVTGLHLTVLKHHWGDDAQRLAKAIQMAWAYQPAETELTSNKDPNAAVLASF